MCCSFQAILAQCTQPSNNVELWSVFHTKSHHSSSHYVSYGNHLLQFSTRDDKMSFVYEQTMVGVETKFGGKLRAIFQVLPTGKLAVIDVISDEEELGLVFYTPSLKGIK